MSFIKDYLAYAEHTGSRIKPLFKVLLYANLLFRLSNFFYQFKLVPVARLFWFLNRIIFAIDIDPRAQLNGGMVILHGAGIVIGRYVLALGDFKIYQGATLGGNNGKHIKVGGAKFSQPIVKKDVVIGINSVVIGPVTLNSGCRIGANAVVTKDVPENMIIVGNNIQLALTIN
ncbi:hypothetical protein LAG90_14825 [Marinilongibacter aquaticus]|uniref:serine O-acetyltransferase n=1 Tax=Marinilongibacter aquaticus TaxID=2975157 RepID=UPI0021BD0C5F|nr:hypothetical protein [Marinilongibacter aquaticus]UBM58078.1 hypothetical protein LAG90_14825 [Marinilongibacter aquaticus]